MEEDEWDRIINVLVSSGKFPELNAFYIEGDSRYRMHVMDEDEDGEEEVNDRLLQAIQRVQSEDKAKNVLPRFSKLRIVNDYELKDGTWQLRTP
ncbi:MAG TPA: hypothetical protein DF383_10615 [Deltaproteobacteria bacterium]|nr:hypothetical protein [Deltaproteobacteria bacterium]